MQKNEKFFVSDPRNACAIYGLQPFKFSFEVEALPFDVFVVGSADGHFLLGTAMNPLRSLEYAHVVGIGHMVAVASFLNQFMCRASCFGAAF
jgi:hypothetical protein